MSHFLRSFFLLCLAVGICNNLSAKIVKIEITKTETYNNGKPFGDAGEYVRIFGKAYGEVDPDDVERAA